MDCITITDGTTTIQMPRTRSLKVGGEQVGKNVTMASGKVVKEIIGFRTKLSAEWNWLPADTITKIHRLLRKGGFFLVKYPDPDKGDTEGMFEIKPPESGVFKFVDGKPRWKDVSLTMTAQEVE